MSRQDDFTPNHLKVEGPYENDRNGEFAELYKDIIREVYHVKDVIIAHHLTYVTVDKRDGFDYQVVEEIPAADTLIFDHEAAKVLWGDIGYRDVLCQLALEPVETRDNLLSLMYYNRVLQWRNHHAAISKPRSG